MGSQAGAPSTEKRNEADALMGGGRSGLGGRSSIYRKGNVVRWGRRKRWSAKNLGGKTKWGNGSVFGSNNIRNNILFLKKKYIYIYIYIFYSNFSHKVKLRNSHNEFSNSTPKHSIKPTILV
jgi:hypothetical protein